MLPAPAADLLSNLLEDNATSEFTKAHRIVGDCAALPPKTVEVTEKEAREAASWMELVRAKGIEDPDQVIREKHLEIQMAGYPLHFKDLVLQREWVRACDSYQDPCSKINSSILTSQLMPAMAIKQGLINESRAYIDGILNGTTASVSRIRFFCKKKSDFIRPRPQ